MFVRLGSTPHRRSEHIADGANHLNAGLGLDQFFSES